MIFVLATIELVKGKRENFLDEFHRLMPKVLEEEGCIEYQSAGDAKTDISRQVGYREDVITIVEKWDSVAALKAHLGAPHMLEYRERITDLVTDVKLQILEPV